MSETDVELSLTMLLDSAVGFRHFLAFAREQFCEENVLALRAVYRFDQHPTMQELEKIYEKSLDRSSLFAVNISAGCFEKCEKAYDAVKSSMELPDEDALRRVFADVQTELRRLIDFNLVNQFKSSPHFENFLAELDDKEGNTSTPSTGFKRLRSRLGMDTRRSAHDVNSKGNGSKQEKEAKSSTDDPSRESHTKLPTNTTESSAKEYDYLGLPTSFSSRVSKATVSTNLPDSPTAAVVRIEMTETPPTTSTTINPLAALTASAVSVEVNEPTPTSTNEDEGFVVVADTPSS